MKRPVSMKRARSTPVSMPMPPSRPRGHVLGRDVAARPGRIGTAAASMMETPSPRQARMLANAWPRGVVEVHGDAPERDHRPAAGERRLRPDGLAERDLLAPELVQSPGEGRHRSGETLPFVRTDRAHRRDRPAPAGRRPASGPTSDCRLWNRSPGGRAGLPPGKAARSRFGMTAASFRGDK
jgi:hypothetical protein